MTTLGSASANRPLGRRGMFFCGMVTTTSSAPRAASRTETAAAPVSALRSARDSGPRELATETLCPSFVRRRVRVPPICPAPMMPIFMSAPLERTFEEIWAHESTRQDRAGKRLTMPLPSEYLAKGLNDDYATEPRPDAGGARR